MPGYERTLLSLKEEAPKAAMYLMAGAIIGFLFFYKIFHYLCSPFSGNMPMWFLIVALVAIGTLCGYLYPTILNVLGMAFALPMLGAGFCFLIFVSPAFSPDIITAGLAEMLIILAKYMVPLSFLTFVTMLCTGFVSIYLFESYDE